MRTTSETFAPPFSVHRFAVAQLGKDRVPHIVVVSHHHLYYPCQVAILSADGALVREYWHSGHFDHLLLAEYKGRTELLLAGINNAAKSATLVALNPETLAGASAEAKPDYQLQGFAPGVEDARILFPRACFNRLMDPFAGVGALTREDGAIVVDVNQRISPSGASLYYHFKPDLSLKTATVGSSLEAEHASLFATHVLDHQLSQPEIAELERIRYLRPPGGHLQ